MGPGRSLDPPELAITLHPSGPLFIVPTLVKPSAIQGVGVFAAAFIPAGSVIWEFTPEVDWTLSPEELASFPQPFQARLRRYTYLDESGTYVFCGDNAKYMNHEDRPNCDDQGGLYTVAIRDIPAGDELTCDYRSFDTEFDGSEFDGAAGAVSMNGVGTGNGIAATNGAEAVGAVRGGV